MKIREIEENEKETYNKNVAHIIQSWEWGEFRKKLGLTLVRLGHFDGKKLIEAYQLTFHPVPFLKKTIGYLPKGPMPSRLMIDSLLRTGGEKNAAFIKIEPNVIVDERLRTNDEQLKKFGLIKSKKSLFTKYNFLVDLTKSEDQLLGSMHSKTRYNIRLAQKKGVEIYDSVKDSDFEIYLRLYFDTVRRQKYFGHSPSYHRLAWETLKKSNMARVLIAKYQKKPLVAWLLLNFRDTLYYPYGGSSIEHKDVMASNLVAWEAIRLGKKMGLKTLDLWGALSPDVNLDDKWYGFHKFKLGYGPKHVEYVGTYDLVLTPSMYNFLNIGDKIRWAFLRSFRS